jgi:hypothetical protein
MGFEIEDNEFGGQSYFASSDASPQDVPNSFLARLTPLELHFFREPDACLDRMIQKCRHPQLLAWLGRLRDEGFLQTEVHIIPQAPDRPIVAFCYGTGHSLVVPNVDHQPDLPDVLASIYSVIGGLYRGSPEYSFRHLDALPHTRYSNQGWIEETPLIDPNRSYSMISNETGDSIGWHETDPRTVLCDHGTLSWGDSLEDVIKSYFEGLIAGCGEAEGV